MTMNGRVSETTRKAILDCYAEMKGYLHDDNVDNGDCLVELKRKISKNEIAIPAPIYEKIQEFIKEEFDPIIDSPRTVFKSCYTEDIGSFDEENGLFLIESEDGAELMTINFFLTIFEIEERLETFGREVLRPYLLTA